MDLFTGRSVQTFEFHTIPINSIILNHLVTGTWALEIGIMRFWHDVHKINASNWENVRLSVCLYIWNRGGGGGEEEEEEEEEEDDDDDDLCSSPSGHDAPRP